MNKQNYTATIVVNVSPEKALEAISHVSQWWAKRFEGSAEKLGDVFTVRFSETFVNFKISEFVPGKKIVWLVTDCYLHWIENKTEWKGTSVVWDISTSAAGTKIHMTHVGLTPDVACYENCLEGWNEHIKESLFNLIMKGEGSPQ